ncbi:hypothetical protein HYC85_023835 [Camellia sinensis]|uniref:LisH domain-containing protein n=1 Tax=Camellia sinensis TaxID=4442 RepID=A0A7J7GJH7_CAMSI|nr:hypothetical protein HYC85_023835 [Camellia sinensis]
MANPTEWNNRAMFERYLFDYLQKRGLHETAELFWREANLSFDPSSRPALDVPDGFLHEWWLTFYDMFKASQAKNPVNKEGSSYAVEKVTYVGQQGDPSPLREQEVDKQPIRELTASSDFGLSTGGNLMPFMGCHSMKTEQNFQGLASFEPQQKSSTLSKGFYHPSNLGNISTQGVGPSICATLKTEKIAPNESGRKRKHSTCSEDGSNGVPGGADYRSETSSPICKSFNGTLKLSSFHVDGNKDEGKTSSSNSRTNHTTTDTNSSIGIRPDSIKQSRGQQLDSTIDMPLRA